MLCRSRQPPCLTRGRWVRVVEPGHQGGHAGEAPTPLPVTGGLCGPACPPSRPCSPGFPVRLPGSAPSGAGHSFTRLSSRFSFLWLCCPVHASLGTRQLRPHPAACPRLAVPCGAFWCSLVRRHSWSAFEESARRRGLGVRWVVVRTGLAPSLREAVAAVDTVPCRGHGCVTSGGDTGCPGGWQPRASPRSAGGCGALCSVHEITAAAGRTEWGSGASGDGGLHQPRGAGSGGGRWAAHSLEVGSGPLASGTLTLSASRVGPSAKLPCVGFRVTVCVLPTPLRRPFIPSPPLLPHFRHILGLQVWGWREEAVRSEFTCRGAGTGGGRSLQHWGQRPRLWAREEEEAFHRRPPDPRL